jgi:hypothetical protein
MTLHILDPRTGKRVTITVPLESERGRARRQVLRALDRLADPRTATGPRSIEQAPASAHHY